MVKNAVIPSPNPPLNFQIPFNFHPHYNPSDMYALGVFGGSFMNNSTKYLKQYDKGIISDFQNGVNFSNYTQDTPTAELNYFDTLIPRRNRTFSPDVSLKGQHKEGWFQWYFEFFYGLTSKSDSVAQMRIRQWLIEINTHYFYINNTEQEFEGNKFTDPSFLPDRKQGMLEFGVDPTVSPVEYGCGFQFGV